MSIFYHESTQTFHLTNGEISYLMKVLPNGALGQLYCGQADFMEISRQKAHIL